MTRRALITFALLGVISACTRDDLVATLLPDRCPFGQCPSGQDAGPSPDGGGTDAGAPGGGFCAGSGPLVLVGDAKTSCGSAIAERTFRFAVCTCTDLVLAHRLDVDAFDASRGAYDPAAVLPGGSVGVNGKLDLTEPLAAGGSLWVGGAGGVTAGARADLDVGLDLRDQGPLASSARVTVGGAARVNGRVSAASLEVDGTLTLPEGAELAVSGAATTGGVVRAPVTVEAPCACAADELLDVAAIVRRHASANDDAALGLASSALADVTAERTIELPCGRYYFDHIGAHAPLHLMITGRVALFVGGDVALDDGIDVAIADGAELDLFVLGNLVSAGAVVLGSPHAPSHARLYVGGSGTVQLSGGGTFFGNLYAPSAELVASAPVEIFGSAFVRRLAASAPLRVHYDTAVLHAADGCDEPSTPSTCENACECPNVACSGGQCGACVTGADCCAPLFCVDGRCEAAPL